MRVFRDLQGDFFVHQGADRWLLSPPNVGILVSIGRPFDRKTTSCRFAQINWWLLPMVIKNAVTSLLTWQLVQVCMVNSIEDSSLVGEWNKKLQLTGDSDRIWGSMSWLVGGQMGKVVRKSRWAAREKKTWLIWYRKLLGALSNYGIQLVSIARMVWQPMWLSGWVGPPFLTTHLGISWDFWGCCQGKGRAHQDIPILLDGAIGWTDATSLGLRSRCDPPLWPTGVLQS